MTILLITIGARTGDGAAPGDPFTPAVARATREALGPDTQLVLKELEHAPSDESASELGAASHADAVVEVEWSLPDHLRTTIRMQRAGVARWIDRDVGFRVIDEPAERGRTVGFAIASMLPEYAARAESSSKPESPPPGPAATKPVAAPTPPVHAVDSAAHADGASSTDEAETPPEDDRHTAKHEVPLRHLTAISLRGIAAVGVGDPGTAFGGQFDFRRELVPAFALRVGVGARIGLEASGIGTRFFEGQLGGSFRAWSSVNGRASIGLRLDALLAVAQFTFASSSSGAVSKEKTLPGGDGVLEAGYFFTPAVALVAGGGAEALFGKTDVFVGGARRTSLAPVHPVFELGLGIGF